MGSFLFAGVPVTASSEMPQDRLRTLLVGLSGSGKTRLASSIAECGPTLLIDMIGEKGTKSFEGAAWESNVSVARPTTVQQLDDIYWALAKGEHPYKAVVLDSLSAVQKSAMRFFLGHEETAIKEIQKGSKPSTLQTWGQILDLMTDTCTFFYGLADGDRPNPMHVIMTAQAKSHEDEAGGKRMMPDVSKGARGITMAAPSYVLYTDIEQGISMAGEVESNHVVRVGYDPEFYTKARIPERLQGKIPSVLGREQSLTMKRFAEALEIPF